MTDLDSVWKWFYDSPFVYDSAGSMILLEYCVYHPLRVGVAAALSSLAVPLRRGLLPRLLVALGLATILQYAVGFVRYFRDMVLVVYQGDFIWEGRGIYGSIGHIIGPMTFLLPITLGVTAAATVILFRVKKRWLGRLESEGPVATTGESDPMSATNSDEHLNPYRAPTHVGNE